MTEPQSPSAAPSPDDQAFVPSSEPNPVPAGVAFKADPDKWYYLRITYQDDTGKTVTGRAYKIGPNPSTSFWDYMAVSQYDSEGAKFKLHQLHPYKDGWDKWEIDDGNWLSVKATGWIYRSSEYPLGWKIVDGKLYNTYWSGAAGCQHNRFFVSDAYYMGQGLLPEFTCELVEA
jgi:hypothetical protein